MTLSDAIARGKDLIAHGKPAEAADLLAPVVDRAPGDAGVLCEFGIALKLAGRVEEARDVLERAWELAAPGGPDLAQRAGFILALTYGDLQLAERAIEMFEKVRATAPVTPLGDTALYYVQAYRARYGAGDGKPR